MQNAYNEHTAYVVSYPSQQEVSLLIKHIMSPSVYWKQIIVHNQMPELANTCTFYTPAFVYVWKQLCCRFYVLFFKMIRWNKSFRTKHVSCFSLYFIHVPNILQDTTGLWIPPRILHPKLSLTHHHQILLGDARDSLMFTTTSPESFTTGTYSVSTCSHL